MIEKDCRTCWNYHYEYRKTKFITGGPIMGGELIMRDVRRCRMQHDNIMNKWWEDNGEKIPNVDKFDELTCWGS